MKIQNYEIFKLHIDLCKAMANPYRLMTLSLMSHQMMNVDELAYALRHLGAGVAGDYHLDE